MLARAAVEGTNPYDFTRQNLAWAATAIANAGFRASRDGSVDAFGLDAYTTGAAERGITRTDESPAQTAAVMACLLSDRDTRTRWCTGA